MLVVAFLTGLLAIVQMSRATSSSEQPVFNINIANGPCTYPLPFTKEFDIFCQLDYHETTYMCDPSGLLSRTEVEMLDATVRSLNMSSCFCGSSCPQRANRLGIVLVPVASISGISHCEAAYTPSSLQSAAYLFAHHLSRHWGSQCSADLMLVYISSWSTEKLKRPYIIPVYRNGLERLHRYSRPFAVSTRESLLHELQGALLHAQQLVDAEWHEQIVHATIPRWAVGLCCGMLIVVIVAVYIANCVTNRLGKTSQKQKSSVASMRKGSERFRAGFGGGMMMNANSQQKKSVMMFRTFQKSPMRNGQGVNRL